MIMISYHITTSYDHHDILIHCNHQQDIYLSLVRSYPTRVHLRCIFYIINITEAIISIEIEQNEMQKHFCDFLQVMTALASGADLPANVIIDKEGFD